MEETNLVSLLQQAAFLVLGKVLLPQLLFSCASESWMHSDTYSFKEKCSAAPGEVEP